MVRPDRRTQGLGRRMLRQLETLPELASVREFKGTVEPTNTAAQRCMLGAGFEDTGRLDRDGFRIFRRDRARLDAASQQCRQRIARRTEHRRPLTLCS
jgi:RimJ/RimL family protein N-acetyltransferase